MDSLTIFVVLTVIMAIFGCGLAFYACVTVFKMDKRRKKSRRRKKAKSRTSKRQPKTTSAEPMTREEMLAEIDQISREANMAEYEQPVVALLPFELDNGVIIMVRAAYVRQYVKLTRMTQRIFAMTDAVRMTRIGIAEEPTMVEADRPSVSVFMLPAFRSPYFVSADRFIELAVYAMLCPKAQLVPVEKVVEGQADIVQIPTQEQIEQMTVNCELTIDFIKYLHWSLGKAGHIASDIELIIDYIRHNLWALPELVSDDSTLRLNLVGEGKDRRVSTVNLSAQLRAGA